MCPQDRQWLTRDIDVASHGSPNKDWLGKDKNLFLDV